VLENGADMGIQSVKATLDTPCTNEYVLIDMPRGGKSSGHSGDAEAATALVHGPPLVTQFSPPAPPYGYVERPRLRALLERGLREPLTLVSGPAGSGKSTLLASAVAPGAAWVSLEAGDDEPSRFWGAVLTALRLAGAVPPDSALDALAPPVRESRTAFVPLLVNALAELSEPVVLVLDDLHVVRSRECLSQLGFLVLHAPPTLHLVLSARSDPALPLHVLRVRGRLVDIRAADLAFDEAEAAELLAAHGLSVPDRLVCALTARTEGWGAGLRLAALSLQGRDDPERFVSQFAGDDRAVGDYLLAEVLDRQPPRLRAFLLRTSIVDRVCGDLADALTGDGSGADTLTTLERTNGFVLSVDQHGTWFRYHRLFARLLRTRAERELARELPALHGRAARWYAEHGAESHALRHAVAAADWDLAVEVVAEHWLELFVRGQGAAIRSLVDALPPERLREDAELAAALACTALEIGDGDAAELHLAHAELAATGLPEARRRRYLETLALARLYEARLEGDFDGALVAADALLAEAAGHGALSDGARRALVHAALGETALWAHRLPRAADELTEAVALARSAQLDYVRVSALSHLGLVELMIDGPACGGEHSREAIELAGRRGWASIPQTACAHIALAIAAFNELRPEEAAEHLERAYGAAEPLRSRQMHFVLVHLDARMHGALGRAQDGLRALDRFEVAFRDGTPPPYERASRLAMRARLLATLGDLDAARETLAPVEEEPWLVVDVAAGRLLLAAGDPAAAAERLAAAAETGRRETHTVTGVERAVLHAVALDESGDAAGASRALEDALELAERTGHRWPFVEAGRRMEALLRRQIRSGTAHRAVVGELLDAFADRAPVRHAVAPLLEPLSDREQAILRYLPTTLSNREIAAELFVTTNTVKTHLRSIYRKLDVARRREAVERARDLRLLSGGTRR
jgi:LuxR family transcriptional regulator, maltose regulon positive regulatory protein